MTGSPTRSIEASQASTLDTPRELVVSSLHQVLFPRLSRLSLGLSAMRQESISGRQFQVMDARLEAAIDEVDSLMHHLRNLLCEVEALAEAEEVAHLERQPPNCQC